MKPFSFNIKYLILLNIFVIVGIVGAAKIMGGDLESLLFKDDGYLSNSKILFSGNSIFPTVLGSGLSYIYYPIFYFPDSIQPYLRLFISIIFSSGIIVIINSVFRKYFKKEEIFIGSLFFIINPIYIQWTIKSCPEIFLGFFLSLFIYFFIRIIKSYSTFDFILLSLVLYLSFFIKPVFLFIPPSLILIYILLKQKRLILLSTILMIIAIFGFYSYKLLTPKIDQNDRLKASWNVRYGQSQLITNTLWINWVVKTRQFYKPSDDKPYKIPSDLKNYFPQKQLWLYENVNPSAQLEDAGGKYIAVYYNNHKDGNIIGLNLKFISEYPLMFLQKIILSPLFFISMAGSGVFVKLFYNLFFLSLGLIGMVQFKNSKYKIDMLTIAAVILGYSSLYILTHSIDRYSLPILPWVIIWSGVPLMHIYNKFKNRKTEKDILLTF